MFDGSRPVKQVGGAAQTGCFDRRPAPHL